MQDCRILKKSDRMMAMVLVFVEEVVKVICAYATQMGRSDCEEDQFCNEMANE